MYSTLDYARTIDSERFLNNDLRESDETLGVTGIRIIEDSPDFNLQEGMRFLLKSVAYF